MYREKRISPATKMVILAVYTFILFAITITIITATSINEAKGFHSMSRDENIQIVAKLVETRTSDYLKKNTDKEKASWKISYQVAKNNPNVDVKNIEIFTKAVTEEDKEIYFETTKKAYSSYKGDPSTNGTALQSYPKYTYSETQIEKTNKINTKDNTYTKANSQLSIVYVTVFYHVDNVQKEMKFYFIPAKPDQYNFENFTEEIDLTENKGKRIVFNKNGYTTVSITPTIETETSTSETTINDSILFELKCNEKFLKEEGLFVTDANVTLFAKVKNDASDTENYFSDYITVVDLHGTFVDDNNTKAWSDHQRINLPTFYTSNCSINTTYEVSELYLIVSYTTSDGKTHTDHLKINLNIK
ncbi:MAG: hypothetical protein IKC22_00470 [Bacilli bacterium]|nr:hypothetical protein [Bacilli bacterium]